MNHRHATNHHPHSSTFTGVPVSSRVPENSCPYPLPHAPGSASPHTADVAAGVDADTSAATWYLLSSHPCHRDCCSTCPPRWSASLKAYTFGSLRHTGPSTQASATCPGGDGVVAVAALASAGTGIHGSDDPATPHTCPPHTCPPHPACR